MPVATVAINGGKNAAILASQIIATNDEELASKIRDERKKNAEAILQKDAKLNQK